MSDPDANRRLTPELEKFWEKYVEQKFTDAPMAWRWAYTKPKTGKPPPTVKEADAGAKRCLNNPTIQARYARAMERALQKEVYAAKEIIADWVAILKADPNDLISYRRVNCRHCNGVDGGYQWRDEAEYLQAVVRATSAKPPAPVPPPPTSFGFRANGPVNTDCKQCDGEGIGEVFIADTRTREKHPLYRGVKQTTHGIQIMMADQDVIRKTLAEHLGMFAKAEGGGGTPKEPPKPGELATLSAPEAMKRYQDVMG